jgi:hypothetical protein
MMRDDAVIRINDGLGFRATGHSLTDKIILRLQEAQRDLEKGKTLPPFLILEDETFTLPLGEHAVDLPDNFIRLDDNNLPHFTNFDTFLPTYLTYERDYSKAVQRLITMQRPGEPQQTVLAPRLFVIRSSTIDFLTTADRDYELTWNYYQAGALLTSNIENLWLSEAPEWLIGEAGYRICRDARDEDGAAIFDDMRQRARAAVFGDMLADEDSGGPLIMGVRN